MFSVEKIIEGIAVLIGENEEKIQLPLEKLPKEISQGDLVHQINGEWVVDNEKTAKKRTENYSRLNRLSLARED